jgi:hypothetical protein
MQQRQRGWSHVLRILGDTQLDQQLILSTSLSFHVRPPIDRWREDLPERIVSGPSFLRTLTRPGPMSAPTILTPRPARISLKPSRKQGALLRQIIAAPFRNAFCSPFGRGMDGSFLGPEGRSYEGRGNGRGRTMARGQRKEVERVISTMACLVLRLAIPFCNSASKGVDALIGVADSNKTL